MPSFRISFFISALVSVIAMDSAAQAVVVQPEAYFPIGDFPYSFGAGTSIEARLPVGRVELSPRLGWFGLFLDAGAGRVDAISGELGTFFPLMKGGALALGPSASVGFYTAFFEDVAPLVNPSAYAGIRADLKAGTFTLGIEPGAEIYFASREGIIVPFWFGAGLRAHIAFEPSSGPARPRLRMGDPSLAPFYPSFYKFYAGGGLGSVQISNEERSAIQDLRIEVFAPRYMDGPQTIASISVLGQGEKAEFPIAALFRNEVLGVTETDSAQVRITAKYRRGETQLELSREANMRILGRNSISWDDDRKAAAFVTAKDPTILKLGRNVVSGVPVEHPGAGTEALRKAAAIFSALGEFGLRYVIDPASSYQTLSGDTRSVDYIQFPVQTLDYRSGDCDDLTVLFASLLEAVGVETAFITVPGHIYAAFSLGISEVEAKRIFSSVDDLIYIAGNA